MHRSVAPATATIALLTDDHLVHLVQQVHDKLNLVADLGASEDGEEGARGRVERTREVVELLLQQKAAQALRQIDANHARVRAVCRAEGVVHVDVTVLRQLGSERGDLLLARLELRAVRLDTFALLGDVEA